jgi:hypothetical protein
VRARTRATAVLAVATLLTSCAPRPTGVAPLGAPTRVARYLAGRLARERRAAGRVEIAATVFPRVACDSCRAPGLPALQAALTLGWPDALRARVATLFGTALDLSVRGDSIVGYVPPRRWAIAADAVRDSFGLPGPGRLLVCALVAGWSPPDGAWSAAAAGESLAVARWREPGVDSIALAIAPDGRPAWVRLVRADGHGLEVRYLRWARVDGVDWPTTLELVGTGDPFRVTLVMDEVRFAPARPERLAARVPAGAVRLGVDTLRELLRRMGGE